MSQPSTSRLSKTSSPTAAAPIANAHKVFKAKLLALVPDASADADAETLAAIESVVNGFNVQSLTDDDLSNLAKIAADVDYQGFDAAAMRALLAKKSPATFKSDMQSLMMVYIRRGPNIGRILLECRGASKDKIQALVNTYGIKKNIGNTTDRRNVVTLPRMAICFVKMACALARIAAPENQVNKADVDFRAPLRLPCFAALIPRSGASNLYKAHVLFMTLQSQVWLGGKVEATKDLILDQQRWVEINQTNGVHSDEERRKILEELAMTNMTETEMSYARRYDSIMNA